MTSPVGTIVMANERRRRMALKEAGEYLCAVHERDILRVITDACDKGGVPYMRNYNSKVVTVTGGEKILAKLPPHQKGKPDVTVLCADKLTIWIETKAPTGKLSDDQERWRDWIIKRGHEYHAPRTVAEAHQVAAVILRIGR